jgi:hypothetical protein
MGALAGSFEVRNDVLQFLAAAKPDTPATAVAPAAR